MFAAVFLCFAHHLHIGCKGGRGWLNGFGTQRAYAVFHFGQLKIEVFETCFFDIVITQNDHPTYANYVSARIYVFFAVFWVCVAWGRFSARWTCQRQ